MKLIIKTLLPLLVLPLITLAQKLPNVQTSSMWAPVNIKIDGNATEWGNQYQAHNNATNIYYTLSNDDENIYLIINIKNAFVIDKIIKGCISFTVNHTKNKKVDSAITINYPVLNRTDRNTISMVLNSKIGFHNDAAGIDNSLNYLNNLLATRSKNINVQGIKSIMNGDISVYNEEGIKAVSKFNEPLVYIYELAVPLKYLDMPNNGAAAFNYNVKLNVEDDAAHNNAAVSISLINTGLPPPPPPAIASIAPTDFWGKYILAKKL